MCQIKVLNEFNKKKTKMQERERENNRFFHDYY